MEKDSNLKNLVEDIIKDIKDKSKVWTLKVEKVENSVESVWFHIVFNSVLKVVLNHFPEVFSSLSRMIDREKNVIQISC